ncbi:MAG TPA: HU family DNA-binding protein [Candidatus Eisenbacteria bacterium]|jgi:DNA-binding protein HU-beta
MNKADLIEYVANDCGLTKKDAAAAVESTLTNIKKGVKKGNVQIIGFGSFAVTRRKARMGRNPQTGESIKIAASKSVRFKPGKEFKDKL